MNHFNSLDTHSLLPEAMRAYIENYGFHFSKKACDYAISLMRKKSPNGGLESIDPWSKEQVEEMLQKHGVTLTNNKLYDAVYVANMAQADYYKSSLEDEKHIALYVKDTIDDTDTSNESVFRCWLAKLVGNGEPLEWADLL